MLKRVKGASKSQNILHNTQKTNIVVVDKGRERKEVFIRYGNIIEEVKSFVYLGSLINIKGSSAQEIRRRLAMGRGAVQNMVSIWKSRGMSSGLNVRRVLILSNCGVIEDCSGCHGWRRKETMGVGQEEDEVLWPHRPKKQYGEKIDAEEDGR